MAKLVGHVLAVVGDVSAIDGPTTVASANGLGQRNVTGEQSFDDAGNKYVYVAGVASVAAGDWVFYNQLGTFTMIRVQNDAAGGGPSQAGQVGVAMAAVIASCWGWVAIFGNVTVANVATVGAPTASVALYRSGTTARLSTSAVPKDSVYGAYLVGASVSNVGPVALNYPFVQDQSTL
jgi:hypothetical protein